MLQLSSVDEACPHLEVGSGLTNSRKTILAYFKFFSALSLFDLLKHNVWSFGRSFKNGSLKVGIKNLHSDF